MSLVTGLVSNFVVELVTSQIEETADTQDLPGSFWATDDGHNIVDNLGNKLIFKGS